MSAAGLLARSDLWTICTATVNYGLFIMALGLILALPRTTRLRRTCGQVIFLIGLGVLAFGSAQVESLPEGALFWLLATVTIVAAAAAISMTSAVYCAVWFALSVLGAAGLFVFQGSQFLGIATIAVYAGAIVVTFLFVLMLAQPEGAAVYDRISWGTAPRILSPLLAAGLVAMLTPLLPAVSSGGSTFREHAPDVLHASHVARFGAELFSRHLITVELAGTLLLVALVGAIAILSHGADDQPTEDAA